LLSSGLLFYSRAGLFHVFAFHPFIEQFVQILKSIKLIGISWEKKGGTKICSHCFVEKAIASLSFHKV